MERSMTVRTPLHTGGCQCGAVRFAVYIQPRKIGLCHCRMCQKAAGAPFTVLAEVPWGDFAWTRGTPATFRSSSRSARDFCAACGTPLSYREVGGPIVELMTGTFDDPSRVGSDRELPASRPRHVSLRDLRRPVAPPPRQSGVDALALEAGSRH
jgi:hypothetical protein